MRSFPHRVYYYAFFFGKLQLEIFAFFEGSGRDEIGYLIGFCACGATTKTAHVTNRAGAIEAPRRDFGLTLRVAKSRRATSP